MKRTMNREYFTQFQQYLLEDEKSSATIEKYMRDLHAFAEYAGTKGIDKAMVLRYKEMLETKYAPASANSMLAAVNTFFRYKEWDNCCVKPFKVQKKTYLKEEKELTRAEYQRLIYAARSKRNERLSLVIQTICGTGIRVSELKYMTLEAVKQGEAIVSCKGKIRTVFIIKALQKLLLAYAKKRGIQSGPIFVTRAGRPMDRSNIWREMKSLCEQANVLPDKVFPHNLRHLFARTFYGIERDIAKLADILGHTNMNTTRIYIMTSGEEHRQKIEQLQLVL